MPMFCQQIILDMSIAWYLSNILKKYISETTFIAQRLIQHNSGTGLTSTDNVHYQPWAVSAFICGLSHMNRQERMSLERRWKIHVEEMQQQGQQDSWSWINVGQPLVANVQQWKLCRKNTIRTISYFGLGCYVIYAIFLF